MATYNPELDEQIRNWAVTSAKLAEMKTQLKLMEKEVAGAEDMIIQVMEMADEAQRRVDDIVVTVKKKSEGGRVKYKEGFLFLMSKVNDQLKEMADSFLAETSGDTWVKKWLQRESIDEGIMKRVWDAIRAMLDYFSSLLVAVGGDIDKLEDAVKEMEVVESVDTLLLRKATALLR